MIKTIEINLLPRREEGSKGLFYGAVAVVLASVLAISYFSFSGKMLRQEIETAKTQAQQIAESRTELEQRLNGISSSSSYDMLSKTVEWATTYPIKTINVLDDVTGLLPKRGFITTFSYSENGAISLVAQFDQSSHAGDFYKQLQQAPWVKEVTLSAVTTKEATKEEDASKKEIMPRYIGNYTVTLNYQAIKEIEKKRGEEQ